MKKISIRSLLELSFLSHPLISPDGLRVAFNVQKANIRTNGYDSDLFLVQPDGGVEQVAFSGGVGSYLWGEDGSLFLTTAPDAAEQSGTVRLYAWTAGSEAAWTGTVLPADAELLQIDAQRVLFTAGHTLPASRQTQEEIEREGSDTVDVFDELPFWKNGAGVINRRRRGIYRLDRSSGETVRITQAQFDVEQVSIQGERLLYTGCFDPGHRPDSDEVRLYELTSGADRRLLAGGVYDFSYVGLWNGAAIMMAVSGSKLSAKLDGDFYRIDLESGAVSCFARYGHACCIPGGTSSDARLGAFNAVAVDEEYLYFSSNLEGNTFLCRLDREGRIEERLTGDGSCDSFDARRGRVVVCGMFADRPCELYEGGVRLTGFNDAFFAEYQVSTPEPYRFTDADGYEIQGWCLKPIGHQPGRRYPAVLQIHGGPRVMYGGVFYHEMQALAAAGYFVMFCNPRGSDGYGDKFAELDDLYGTVDYQNLMHFVDRMLERYPDIDPARLGVAGGSYGGFMTNWIIGQTDRFAAAVSQRSTALWLSFTLTGDISTIYDPLHLCALEEDKLARAWELSPLKYAARVKTPTLFIQADEDYRCYMCDAVMMYTALQLRGVDSRLCLFRGENHSLSRTGKPLARIRRLREIVGWFERCLAPAPDARRMETGADGR